MRRKSFPRQGLSRFSLRRAGGHIELSPGLPTGMPGSEGGVLRRLDIVNRDDPFAGAIAFLERNGISRDRIIIGR